MVIMAVSKTVHLGSNPSSPAIYPKVCKWLKQMVCKTIPIRVREFKSHPADQNHNGCKYIKQGCTV